MTAHTVAILGFHKIGEPPLGGWQSWFNIPEATFVDQLGYLKTNGWPVIDLAALLCGVDAPESLPERAALLTFDDGYQSLVDVALPRLIQFGYPAVVFVPTRFIGGTNEFDVDEEPEEAMCGWEDLRELERQHVSVQSHSVSHRTLSQLTCAEQEDELVCSKAVLETGLNKPVDVFAYPYGDAGLGVDWREKRKALRGALQRAGYRAAFLYGGRPQQLPARDRFRLARVAMGPDTHLRAELSQ
jgi:peptidoglycan/xylan/chitin deacetylase (PgdA/CDA1 family)